MLLHRVAHAVLVLARLRGDRVGDGRLGQLAPAGTAMQRAFVAQRIAGERVLQLGHRADVAGVNLGHGRIVFTEQRADMRQPLRRRQCAH